MMSATWQAIFYVAGVGLFLMAALRLFKELRIGLLELGLACVFFPLAWNAVAGS